MVKIRLLLLITGKSITKKCDDPIKESGAGPKENALQHCVRFIAIHHAGYCEENKLVIRAFGRLTRTLEERNLTKQEEVTFKSIFNASF